MIILEQTALQIVSYAAKTIKPPSLNAVIWIAIITIAVAFFIWYFIRLIRQRRERERHQLEMKHNVVGMFLPRYGGLAQFRLCKEEKGEVVDVLTDDGRTIRSTGKKSTPFDVEGNVIDHYLPMEEHDYQIEWPLDKPKAVRITAPLFIWQLNDPRAKVPHDASKWDEQRYRDVTAKQFRQSKDEKDLDMIQMSAAGILSKLQGFEQALKRIPTVVLLSMINLGWGVLMGLVLYWIKSDIGVIRHFLGG